jgi:hypothetical protein
MEPTTDQIAHAVNSADHWTAPVLVSPDTEASYRDRIHFDGFFTGPTW